MMSKTTDIQTAKATGDVVLQEIWRIKDTLSASYGHDVDRLFAKAATPKTLPPSGCESSNQAPQLTEFGCCAPARTERCAGEGCASMSV